MVARFAKSKDQITLIQALGLLKPRDICPECIVVLEAEALVI